MNLINLLTDKKYCPICNKQNKVCILSKNKQINSIDNNLIKAKFEFNRSDILLKKSTFKYEICLDVSDNSFFIEFYSPDNEKLTDYVPTYLIRDIKKYISRFNSYPIYWFCNNCNRYSSQSDSITLNFKKSHFTPDHINMKSEQFVFIEDLSDKECNIYYLSNFLNKNKSHLNVERNQPKNKIKNHSNWFFDEQSIELPLINIKSCNDIISKLNKIILFS